MFRRRYEPTGGHGSDSGGGGPERVTVAVEGRTLEVPAGETVAAVLLAADMVPTRTTPVSGAPRAPYCMMGVCFDCLVEIDGSPNRQACMVPVADGMSIRRQCGARQA